jgi:SAM-dependent methyltransferase
VELDRIICGDCLQVLPTLPDESIDLVATDPPYGISFMGKAWDRAVPPVRVWKECLRVLKPGAFAFVMCIPRQDCLARMIINLEEAGFSVNFTSLYHCFATGFPKAEKVSLIVDKRACMTELTRKLGRKPTREEFQEAWRTYRETVGKGYGTSLNFRNEANKEQGYRPSDYYAEKNGEFNITTSTNKEAKALDGSYGGFQPKPALEIVISVMKPLSEKSYADQVLKNMKGTTWLDDGRIPFELDGPTGVYGTSNATCKPTFNASPTQHEYRSSPHEQGRFPANLLVSNDALNDGQLRESHGHFSYKWNKNPYEGGWKANPENAYYQSGFGCFSRFFSLDAWFEERLKQLPESVQRTFPFLIVIKAGKSERNRGLDGLPLSQTTGGGGLTPIGHAYGSVKPVQQNTHPSVKPIKLMSYLVTLGSRPGDIVLDPFCGTGTTCIASLLFPAGQERHYLGVEIDPTYCGIAEKRVAWWKKKVRGLCGPVVLLRFLQVVFHVLRTRFATAGSGRYSFLAVQYRKKWSSANDQKPVPSRPNTTCRLDENLAQESESPNHSLGRLQSASDCSRQETQRREHFPFFCWGFG